MAVAKKKGFSVGLLLGDETGASSDGADEEAPASKKTPAGEPEEDSGASMKAARLDALKEFKVALDGEDFEAADMAWADYKAACEELAIMAAIRQADLIVEVREYGHLAHLTHVTDAEIGRRLDRSYRRLRAMQDNGRGQEVEKKTVYARLQVGKRFVLLPSDFYQLRGTLVQRIASAELAE